MMTGSTTTPAIVQAERIGKQFGQQGGLARRLATRAGLLPVPHMVHALDDVDITVHKGEVVGLVGESGCGKSTLGRIVAGISKPSSGTVRRYAEQPALHGVRPEIASRLAIQMVFQDPMASLNPRMRVRDIILGAPLYHGMVKKREAAVYLAHLMSLVGLDASYAKRYPHQFSGGQRARIGIARALAVNPLMLVCDESVAALDVSIQAQIINLFIDLRDRLGLTYLFISHDLGVIRHIADRVVIMYLGRVIETGPTRRIFADPKHPYTRALLESAPEVSREKRVFHPVKGEIPSPLAPPKGCHFHPRCPLAGPRCSAETPRTITLEASSGVRCHLYDGGVG